MDVNTILVIGALGFGWFVGGFITGIDRVISARLQGRIGPPILQPFYDVAKLLSKRGSPSSKLQVLAAWLFMVSNVLALCLLAIQSDMIAILYVLTLGSVAFIMAAYSVKSPYAILGAQREVMQLLVYEPLLIFLVVGYYLQTKSFLVSGIVAYEKPLLFSMPLFFVAMIMVLLIKMRKSPFDIAATAHHAHQEVVQGPLTEMSGPTLAMIEIAHWYEMICLLALISMMWAPVPIVGTLLALGALFLSTLIDNLAARLSWKWMLSVGWAFGIAISLINLAYIYAITKSSR